MMDHSDFSETHSSSSQAARFSDQAITTRSDSWSFDHSGSDPPRAEAVPRSIFSSSTSPSRFASPSASTPALRIFNQSHSAGRVERARSPSPTIFSLDPPPSEHWRANRPDEDEVRATSSRRRLPRVEKDVDDPTQADSVRPDRISHHRTQSNTLTTLSRLFAVKAATSPTDPRDHPFNSQPSVEPRRCEYGADVVFCLG